MLRNLSYRFKVPLMLSVTILLTAVVVTLVLTWRAYDDLRDELFRNAAEVGAVLSNTLPTALKHDDLWNAYQILGAAVSSSDKGGERLLIVLDKSQRVYVSNDPERFPTLSALRLHGSEFARVEHAVASGHSLKPYAFEHPDNERIFVIVPLLDDGVAVGILIVGYLRSVFIPRFYAIVQGVVFSSLAVLAILLPVGWYLGKRMVTPLARLADGLREIGRQPLEQIHCPVYDGDDEIGQLGARFQHMLQGLQEKQRLEQQVVASQRLAAVGRLAAGVAHEINNPLGGMLNAINTFKHHGHADTITKRTLSLLERGLAQIQDTVSALLVEARPQSHPLTPQDVDDVHMLLQPDARKKALKVGWHNGLKAALPLPSTEIRQVLINLSLNAVQAAPRSTVVDCRIEHKREQLQITVKNQGNSIVPTQTDRLFEPFVHDNPAGNGLGLWVTYQIVRQMRGQITVKSEDGHTCFTVHLPLESAA
jgi:signal transduction histidine kinase